MGTFGSYTIEKCVELYDAGGEVEAVCFNFFPKGYVIVNVNDFSVPEFSPEAVTPFPNELGDGYYVYVGPLSYYSNDGVGTLTNLRTGKTGTVEQLNYVYDIHPDNDARTATGNVARASVTRASLSFMTKHQPVTWTSPATLYKCGLDSCAIELKYLHDYHDTNLLTYFTNANYALQKHLLDGKYIPNTGTYACDIVDGIGNYTGINAFFKYRKSTIRAYYKAYSNSVMEEMEESFEDDYPVIIGTESADDWDFAEHWIIAYG